MQHPPPGRKPTAELGYSRAQLLTTSFFPQETTSGSQLCSAELQPAPDKADYHWGPPIPNAHGPTEREERARWDLAADHCPKA